jgi:hypothetical protein
MDIEQHRWMRKRKRSTVSATEMRVRMGEMLRRLKDEDLVIEKGGVPVAVVTRYTAADWAAGASDYERALSSKGDAAAWPDIMRYLAADPMDAKTAEAMKAEIYRARDESVEYARYYMDDVPEQSGPAEEGRRVADRGATGYDA